LETINRRRFIAAAGVAAGTVAFLPRAARASGAAYGFLHESGKRGGWPLVVGLLATASPSPHDLAIDRLRRRHDFPRILRYSSTDRAKAGFAAALIDYYATANDLTFSAVVASDPGVGWTTAVEKDTAYAAIYRQLLETAASPEMVIAIPHRNHNPRDQVLRQFLANDLGVATVPANASNLTQLAGFLAGCVYSDIAAGATNTLKQSLTGRLMAQLGGTPRSSASAFNL